MVRRVLILALMAAVAPTPTGCDHYPADPRGSLEHAIERGTLRVGAIEHDPRVRTNGREVRGPEADLIRGFAHRLGVDVEWSTGAPVLEQLERGELDVVIGGLARDDPWERRVGFTLVYDRSGDRKLVMAVPRGENALLMELEAYLLDTTGGPP